MTASRHKTFPPSLAASASKLTFDAGRIVFRAGTPPRHIHFIEDGAVRLIRLGRDGEELVLHDARPGEFLAEAALGNSRYHCDVVAAEPSVVLRVPKQAPEGLLDGDPVFAREWIALLAGQL